MATKTYVIKATSIGTKAGPFDITDNNGNVIASGVTRDQILAGFEVSIDDSTTSVTLTSTGECVTSNTIPVEGTVTNPLSISVSSKTDETSNDGNDGGVTVTGAGGTAPYTYSIDGINFQSSASFSNLAPGTYTVTIKDSTGATATTSVTIAEYVCTIQIGSTTTVSPTFGLCDGSVTVNITGGVAPIQYSIDNGATFQSSNQFTNKCEGTFAVVVKDSKNCQATTQVTLTELPSTLLFVSATPSNPTYDSSDGSITVAASGGTSPYQYSIDGGVTWQTSNVFENLPAGDYTIQVKDSVGSIVSGTATLVEVAPVFKVVDIITKNPDNCPDQLWGEYTNGAIQFSGANGVEPYQYSIDGVDYFDWSYFVQNNTSGIREGNYTLYVKDSTGAIATSEVTLTNCDVSFSFDSITTTSVSTSGATDGTITSNVSGSTCQYSVQYTLYKYEYIDWQGSDGWNFKEENTTGVFSNLGIGQYKVNASLALVQGAYVISCGATEIETSIAEPLSISANYACESYQYSSYISLTGSGGTAPYEYSIDGGLTWSVEMAYFNIENGDYTLMVKDATGATASTTYTVNQVTYTKSIELPTFNCELGQGNSDASVTIVASGGTPPYQYSLDGFNFQGDGVFTGLSKDNYYQIYVTDSNGVSACQDSSVSMSRYKIYLCAGISQNATNEVVADGFACIGQSCSDGDCQYSFDGGTTWFTYQESIDQGLVSIDWCLINKLPGSYTVKMKSTNGETAEVTAVIGSNNILGGAVQSTTNATFMGSDGSITLSVAGGTGPYEYSIDGGVTWQTSNVFTGLPAGDYNFVIKDSAGQQAYVTGTVTQNEGTVQYMSGDTCGSIGTIAVYHVNQTVAVGDIFYLKDQSGNYAPYTNMTITNGGNTYVTDANGAVVSITPCVPATNITGAENIFPIDPCGLGTIMELEFDTANPNDAGTQFYADLTNQIPINFNELVYWGAKQVRVAYTSKIDGSRWYYNGTQYIEMNQGSITFQYEGILFLESSVTFPFPVGTVIYDRNGYPFAEVEIMDFGVGTGSYGFDLTNGVVTNVREGVC